MHLIPELKKFYNNNNRAHLPWRSKRPLPTGRQAYKILVSELMLQQTQVDRVVPKYKEFLRAFPNVLGLAKAPLSKVLLHWSGLGYNRRAKYLHEAAKRIVKEYNSKFPRDVAALEELPGIGHYTARAVTAFAFNQPEVFVETNIRTVFIHFYFSKKENISDAEILPLVAKALKESKMQPRDFYAALMDYGSHLKKQGITLNSKSKHYTKQSKFEGSARQLRGALVRELLKSPKTMSEIKKNSDRTSAEIERELTRLMKDGLILKKERSL